MRAVLAASIAAAFAGFFAPAAADTLIVGNKAEDTVSFIDLETGAEVARRATGKAPHEIALSPDGETAVVVSYRAQGFAGTTLHLFDVPGAVKIGEIDIAPNAAPHGLKWIPDTTRVAVTTEASKTVVVVDIETREIIHTIATDNGGAHMIALHPDRQRAFAASIEAGQFSVVNLEDGAHLKDVKAGEGTEAIAVTPDGGEIWVGNNGSRTIMIFDAMTYELVDTIGTAGVPIRVEISPDGAVAAVSEYDKNRIIIYDAALREQIAVVDLAAAGARAPVTLLFSSDGEVLWAASTGSQEVFEISTSDWRVIRSLPAGEGSDGLGLSPVAVSREK